MMVGSFWLQTPGHNTFSNQVCLSLLPIPREAIKTALQHLQLCLQRKYLTPNKVIAWPRALGVRGRSSASAANHSLVAEPALLFIH